jgi:hypothetical protein
MLSDTQRRLPRRDPATWFRPELSTAFQQWEAGNRSEHAF